MTKKILLVDDDALMRRSLAFHLEQAGYTVSATASAEDAFGRLQRETPDLVLLDIGLPGMDGLDALRRLKSQAEIPVIFLTARRRGLDEVLGLELGADDYISKPFDVDVLLAHIKAVLRRFESAHASTAAPPAALSAGDLMIDLLSHECTLGGKPLALSPREFDLLYSLALEPNRVFSVDDLLARVWGAEFAGQPQVVYVHVRWLREKIETDPKRPERLVTVRGVGYKLIPKED
ncbi:MAG: response regulator transcription factor [Anaerolineaceae bacterium]|nr:response regulator transcription factor [Anaerolineaceae bacterium]